MSISVQVGYHTCKLDNGYDFILSNIPFLSGAGPNQWMTQGFYFWTDSVYWAQQWGKPGSRVIGKFHIELCLHSELLDLVGNVAHQQEFLKFRDLIFNRLSPEKRNTLTVNQILCKLREDKLVFPYLAVKAQDDRRKCKVKFISTAAKPAFVSLVTRQQLCVFEEARDRINLCGFVEPQDFAAKMSAA